MQKKSLVKCSIAKMNVSNAAKAQSLVTKK